jgi:hypothetical protein
LYLPVPRPLPAIHTFLFCVAPVWCRTLAQVRKNPLRAVVLPPNFVTKYYLGLLQGLDNIAGVVVLRTPQVHGTVRLDGRTGGGMKLP